MLFLSFGVIVSARVRVTSTHPRREMRHTEILNVAYTTVLSLAENDGSGRGASVIARSFLRKSFFRAFKCYVTGLESDDAFSPSLKEIYVRFYLHCDVS